MITTPVTLDQFTDVERQVLHGTLLAQVDDVHAGGVYSWDQAQVDCAAALFAALEPLVADDLTARVLALCLMVQVHDMDHPELAEAEWDLAQTWLATLSETYGR